MQNVINFIDLLGENYYLDFIIEPNLEEIDYEKHFVLVHYQDKRYYEQPHDYIQKRQNEIINNIKSLYHKSISDIYLEVSKRENNEIEKFLNFNIQAVKVKLNILKNDFYLENYNSRYYALLYDDADGQTFESFFPKREYSGTTLNVYIKGIIDKFNSDNVDYLAPDNPSDYYLGFHKQRFKLLSSLPFKLFHIGHKFIFELDRIKKLNSVENTQPSDFIKMKDTYFDKFCELIDDYTILKKSTAIGVMIDLQLCIKEIKSETLLELQQNGINRNDHLEFKINEVEKCNYDKNADIHYVEKWLKNYNTTIDEILKNTFQSSSITGLIDSHYNDMEKFSKEKDLAFNIQSDFYQYFCKYYADELISYFKSKMVGIEKENNEDSENANQLSVNQAIILLDKLGIFNDKALENLSNVKKAKLISQLIGKNEKNIKTAIQKLELKPSEITPNYQKDIDKIERILENLE